MSMPSIKQALDLFEEGLKKLSDEQPHFAFYSGKSLQSHCCLVACCAEIIASRLPDIDGHKAYTLGLLHDYGKLVKDAENTAYFHGLTGYEAMTKLGYDEVARICLTHTFYDKNFPILDFNYPIKDLRKVKKILANIEYDDYDRLIQLCDLLVIGFGYDNLKSRMNFIREKYRVSTTLIKKKYRDALSLKFYFDRKCGCDIYQLLGIN